MSGCLIRLSAQDLMRIDAERSRDIRISLVEGAQLLGSFDVRLREYAARKLHDQGIHLIKVGLHSPSACTSSLLPACAGGHVVRSCCLLLY